MAKQMSGITRRQFLKKGATAAAAAAVGPYIVRDAFAASRERITIYHSSVADSLHPYDHSSSPIYGNWQHIMEPLVEYDYQKKDYVGILADSWEFQGKRWVMRLKKGIKFHNGAPLTSKDVAFSIDKMRDEKSGSLQASNFKEVTEVQTPDDQTVIFVTKQPLAIFLDRLENRFILSKVAGDKYGDQLYQNPIGTGPYRFVSYQRGGNFVFTRNDDYWGSKANIKEVVFRKVTEDAARLAALEAGQADVVNNVPEHEVARLQRHPRVKIAKVEGLRMFFLALNVQFKPFDNKLVRQAVNYSVDAPAIVRNIFEGIGYVTNGPVGANVVGADPRLKRYPYDPKRAKDLLAQAGYPERLRRSALLFRGTLPERSRGLSGDCGADGQRRFPCRADLAGMGAVLGQSRCERRKASLLLHRTRLTDRCRYALRSVFSDRDHESGSTTVIRSSID